MNRIALSLSIRPHCNTLQVIGSGCPAARSLRGASSKYARCVLFLHAYWQHLWSDLACLPQVVQSPKHNMFNCAAMQCHCATLLE